MIDEDEMKWRRKKKRQMVISEDGQVVALRKIVKLSDSYYISIPKEFLVNHGLKEGDVVPVLANDEVRIVPMKGEG